MKDRKIIIVGSPDAGKVIEALEATKLEIPVIIVDDFRELEQEVFEMQAQPLAERVDLCLPTKKELHNSKMERLRKRRRK